MPRGALRALNIEQPRFRSWRRTTRTTSSKRGGREVLAHLGAPPLAVAFNAVLEALGESAGVEVLGPSFACEERSTSASDSAASSVSRTVVEVPALDALDDAAELLGADLLDRVDGKRKRIG